MKILVLNAGSSTYKFSLYDIDKTELAQPLRPLWEHLYERDPASKTNELKNSIKDLLENLPISISEIEVVGHRIVHGGENFKNPIMITPEVKEALKQLLPLAPLHNPRNLEGIEIIEELLPTVPQIAVFDTAFHSTLSEEASTYPGPYEWKEMGIKRYGFHGINYQYVIARTAYLLKQNIEEQKIIACHLGNGASIAAIDKGASIDTTMGFTPIEGLMMGSRSGSIDPSIPLFLQKNYNKSIDELYHELNFSSGLKGISGVTSDMRDIIRLKNENEPRALLAYQMYIHSIKRNLGAMMAVLGGANVLVFTGGIGENASSVRADVCKGFNFLGIEIDENKNENSQEDSFISSDNSKIKILVIRAEEDWCIANTVKQLMKG